MELCGNHTHFVVTKLLCRPWDLSVLCQIPCAAENLQLHLNSIMNLNSGHLKNKNENTLKNCSPHLPLLYVSYLSIETYETKPSSFYKKPGKNWCHTVKRFVHSFILVVLYIFWYFYIISQCFGVSSIFVCDNCYLDNSSEDAFNTVMSLVY